MCGRPAGPRTGFGLEPDQSDEREEGERRLDEEDRLPTQGLRQDSARRGPQRGADHPRGRPRAHRARIRSVDRRQQVERGAHEERAAERLHAPRPHEDAERRREAAEEGRRGEDDRPDAVGGPRPATRGVRGGDRREREAEVVGRQHPRDLRDLDVELAQNVRQRKRDDGRVREREPDPEAHEGPPPSRAHRPNCRRPVGARSARPAGTIAPCRSGP